MNILLDECVPWPIHRFLVGHRCTSPQKRGWGGAKNGELIRLAEEEHDLFITSDQSIRYQQNSAGRKIAILELSTNDHRRIEHAATILTRAVNEMTMGEFRSLPHSVKGRLRRLTPAPSA